MAKKRKSKAKIKKQKLLIFGIFVLLFSLVLISSPHVRSYVKRIFHKARHEQVNFSESKQNLGTYSVYGFDVSQYQHVIVWKTLQENQGLEFVFIRASAGKDFRDKFFTYNWRESRENGFIRGAYHYYRPDENSMEQAENFLRQVKLESGDLPPVLDIEDYSDIQSLNSLKSGLLKWLQKVESELGVKPIIYTYYKYYESHLADDERFDDYQFWLARYGQNSTYYTPGENWIFWQYTKHGKLNGVDGDVDLNVFHGSSEELQKLLIQ